MEWTRQKTKIMCQSYIWLASTIVENAAFKMNWKLPNDCRPAYGLRMLIIKAIYTFEFRIETIQVMRTLGVEFNGSKFVNRDDARPCPFVPSELKIRVLSQED
jgi:hypothetical protein